MEFLRNTEWNVDNVLGYGGLLLGALVLLVWVVQVSLNTYIIYKLPKTKTCSCGKYLSASWIQIRLNRPYLECPCGNAGYRNEREGVLTGSAWHDVKQKNQPARSGFPG